MSIYKVLLGNNSACVRTSLLVSARVVFVCVITIMLLHYFILQYDCSYITIIYMCVYDFPCLNV